MTNINLKVSPNLFKFQFPHPQKCIIGLESVPWEIFKWNHFSCHNQPLRPVGFNDPLEGLLLYSIKTVIPTATVYYSKRLKSAMGKVYRKKSRRHWAQASSHPLPVESWVLHLIPAMMCGDTHKILPTREVQLRLGIQWFPWGSIM